MTPAVPATYTCPKLGLFWFIGTSKRQPSRLVSFLQDFEEVPEVDRVRAVRRDPAEAWREIQRLDPQLAPYAFDYFPRGRVEFFAPGRRWMLYVDAKLNRGAFIAYLVDTWRLDRGHLTVKLDRCHSTPTIAPPRGARRPAYPFD